jgi:hypothetical protein
VKNPKTFLKGTLAGIGLMYLFDPDRGRRRRALLRDKSVHLQHRIADHLSGTARHLRNRTIGATEELRSWLRDDLQTQLRRFKGSKPPTAGTKE